LAPTASAQELTFEFQVTIGGVSSDWHAFGLREDAMQGIDGYDLPEPPLAPGKTFRSYLSMFEPLAGLPNRWLYDFRPVNSITLDRVELWQLFIESPALGATCRLDVRAREPIGIPYDLYFFGPGTYYQSVRVPASVSFPIDAPWMVQFFELRLDESVGTSATTWGGVKSLYR
jgi:hypothetical protein